MYEIGGLVAKKFRRSILFSSTVESYCCERNGYTNAAIHVPFLIFAKCIWRTSFHEPIIDENPLPQDFITWFINLVSQVFNTVKVNSDDVAISPMYLVLLVPLSLLMHGLCDPLEL